MVVPPLIGFFDASAKTLYGAWTDPESYFKRFFDVELSLPGGDRESVVRELLRSSGLPSNGISADMFADFLAPNPFGIRVLKRAVQHYALVHGSLCGVDQNSWWWILASRGIDGLGRAKDRCSADVVGAPFDRIACDEVSLASQRPRELLFHLGEMQKRMPGTGVETHEHVGVDVWTEVVS